ncbi:cation:H+ antiporter [Formivibrio citricus]|uniref:Cation:H+ antiporter n=1 Tax=Formivibrio citricus TaxID=83765 RepID=A0A1I4YX28_9NEIS|nr:sodium:calcium antiporter [Formivibrio citricus]SFN42574.1 cation:H+ antiporter [Formivibrio citricus]
MSLWLQLLLCLVVIGIAGWHLSINGDIIARKTGLSGSWVGLILLATATSLPELVAGVSAVTAARAPDIAVGNVLGAAVFNLVFLVVLDALYRKETLYSRAAQGHILSAALGALMISFVGFSLLLDHGGISPRLGHVGAYTPFILVLYLVSMRAVYQYEQRTVAEFVEEQADRYAGITLRQAMIRYALAAVSIVAAGILLPFVAKALAAEMGWEQSFVGTLLVAAVTTVPEAAVTLSALRLGALDMAIANLLGSNLFNMTILAIDDIAFTQGPLLASVNNTHALTALAAVMMNTLVIVGLIFRPKGRVLLGLSWISLGLFMLYIANTWVLFAHGN